MVLRDAHEVNLDLFECLVRGIDNLQSTVQPLCTAHF